MVLFLVLLDLAAAFDMIDHTISPYISYVCLQGWGSNEWHRVNSKHILYKYIKVEGQSSIFVPLNHYVPNRLPQESNVGQILFNIYITYQISKWMVEELQV